MYPQALDEATARATFAESRGDDLRASVTAHQRAHADAEGRWRARDSACVATALALGEEHGKVVRLSYETEAWRTRAEGWEQARDEGEARAAGREGVLRERTEELVKCVHLMRQTIAEAQGQLVVQVRGRGVEL